MTALTPARANDVVTALVLASLLLAAVFFALRPELWRRLWLARVDPRPVALTRVVFGLVVLWGFLALAGDARVLFSDEGMWLPEQARARFGGGLKLTVLHWWSPPGLVFTIYALMLVALALMTLGLWTRWSTLAAWALVLQVQRYQFMHYSGADFVVANFLFLGMLSRWGEAYSLDRWRRRAVTAAEHPPIPAWPMRLMMLQLALIYCATGLSKRGELWANGEALYYALNLDHFYRIPAHAMVAWLQHAGVLPALTHVVRGWEILFPLALVGVVLRGYEADRRAGRWVVPPAWRRHLSWLVAAGVWLLLAVTAGILSVHHGAPGAVPAAGAGRRQLVVTALVAVAPLLVVPAYRLVRRTPVLARALLHWVLGKRVWLVVGLLLHLGIDLFINVGTFAELMLAVYVVWLTPAELDTARRLLRSLRRPSADAALVHPRAGG